MSASEAPEHICLFVIRHRAASYDDTSLFFCLLIPEELMFLIGFMVLMQQIKRGDKS